MKIPSDLLPQPSDRSSEPLYRLPVGILALGWLVAAVVSIGAWPVAGLFVDLQPGWLLWGALGGVISSVVGGGGASDSRALETPAVRRSSHSLARLHDWTDSRDSCGGLSDIFRGPSAGPSIRGRTRGIRTCPACGRGADHRQGDARPDRSRRVRCRGFGRLISKSSAPAFDHLSLA